MKAKKIFGQHFLKDQGIIKQIVDAFPPAEGAKVLEVGPGMGVLTEKLIEHYGDSLYAVEVDPAGGTTYTDMGTTQLLSVPYALYAASVPSSHVSAFTPLSCQSLPSVTTSYAKIADLGTFTKVEDGTFIELNLQTYLRVSAFGTANAVVYELRVDDVATTIGNATGMVRTAATNLPINIMGVFTGLATGSHTVSLWAKGVNGTATDAYYDPGCFNSQGTNNVLVKEYH